MKFAVSFAGLLAVLSFQSVSAAGSDIYLEDSGGLVSDNFPKLLEGLKPLHQLQIVVAGKDDGKNYEAMLKVEADQISIVKAKFQGIQDGRFIIWANDHRGWSNDGSEDIKDARILFERVISEQLDALRKMLSGDSRVLVVSSKPVEVVSKPASRGSMVEMIRPD